MKPCPRCGAQEAEKFARPAPGVNRQQVVVRCTCGHHRFTYTRRVPPQTRLATPEEIQAALTEIKEYLG